MASDAREPGQVVIGGKVHRIGDIYCRVGGCDGSMAFPATARPRHRDWKGGERCLNGVIHLDFGDADRRAGDDDELWMRCDACGEDDPGYSALGEGTGT